jgi:hypothetical protein
VIRLLLALSVFLQSAVPPSPSPANQSPGNATPPTPQNATPSTAVAAAVSSDPATVNFTTNVGLLMVPVVPAKAADYEAVIVALQDAFAKATDEDVRTLANGWRVFKAATDPKGPALYVHLFYPVVPDADYRPSLWLDRLLAGAPAEMLAKYRDAIAGAPSKLGMTEFAHMSVAPIVKPRQ